MISRPIKEGFSGVGRHLAMAISSAIAVTITLLIISLFIIFSYNVQNFTKNIESSMEISVMVDYNYEDSAKEDAIQKSIEAIDGVKKVTYSNKIRNFNTILILLMMKRRKKHLNHLKMIIQCMMLSM